ncbi:MAG: hypothetical protein Ct9H90mP22_1260 [Gammaproteobacteria bacterium]|nr:MAG: hypothetical protein Ct9H90mP22_1260 [Gammaproteobacteria bacterium]
MNISLSLGSIIFANSFFDIFFLPAPAILSILISSSLSTRSDDAMPYLSLISFATIFDDPNPNEISLSRKSPPIVIF